MPHSKNGKPIARGDFMVGKDWAGAPVAGIVVAVNPSMTCCNVELQPTTLQRLGFNADQLVHLEDVFPEQPANPVPAASPAYPDGTKETNGTDAAGQGRLKSYTSSEEKAPAGEAPTGFYVPPSPPVRPTASPGDTRRMGPM